MTLHPLHDDVRPQIEALPLDRSRPLVITDADEVLFAFVRGLERYLNREGYELHLESFALTGNIRRAGNGDVVPGPEVRGLIQDFFDRHTEDLEPVNGAADALSALAARAQILVLSNVPLGQRAARQRALRRHRMDYPLIANIGTKGAAVATMARAVDAPVFFLDDIPHNITSVAEAAADVIRLHMVADPRLARLLDKSADAAARIDDWPTMQAYIEDRLSAAGY